MTKRPHLRRIMAPLDELADAWAVFVRVPERRAAFGAIALIAVAALLLARYGSLRARLIAAAFIVLPAVVAVVFRRIESRLWRDPARVIQRIAGGVDPVRAGRAVRALTLLDAAGAATDEGTSVELARLHVARAVAALPCDEVTVAAESLGRRIATLALVLGLAAAALFVASAWRVMEGLDVLAAVHGVAPIDVTWFEDVEMTSRPPDYLHEEERKVHAYGAASLPRGSLLTMRGKLAHEGRTVTLSDGSSEIPFVDDGAGRLIARWPLGDSVNLRVLVRFGEVVIREPDITRVTSIADLAPTVLLEGAPKKVMLASSEDDGTIPIRYEAQDDHGLREVDLVLRSGVREERRVLARLDGETKLDRGGHVLRASDSFIKKSHGPVEVTVEAKDNDPVTGPKWGVSAPIVVVPPDVGEPEARRLDALRKLRDAMVDALAFRMAREVPSKPKERAAFVTEELRRETDARELLEATLTSTYAGLRVPGRLQAMMRGQARKVHEAANKEAQALSATTHAALVGATEQLVLVVDAVVRGLGQKDTRAACHQLADVADDLALGASQMQRPTDRQRGSLRVDASVHVLEGGARSILSLGVLGRDLGEIVTNDLSRVARAKNDDDLVHAEIAARDLAARLHEPDPSFGARGRSGGRAGGESGGGRGTPGEEGENGDEAEQAFNMAAQELDRLAMDHATEMGKVEQALREGTSEQDLKELASEAKKHAAAVREAVNGLPTVSAGSDSWTSKASAARDQAEAMARALEQGDPADAVTSGKTALDAVDEAKRTAEREKWRGLFAPTDDDADHTAAGKRLGDARKKLEPEVKWAEEQIAKLRKKAAESKAGELSDDAEEERKLGERAGELSREGKGGQALPGPALDSLEEAQHSAQEAANDLKRGDVDHALERQREAQHQLEMAKEALGSESSESGSGEGGRDDGDSDRDTQSHVDIPKADASKGKGAEQFRRRVLKGLSEAAGGRQRDAVRRYAEGLLR